MEYYNFEGGGVSFRVNAPDNREKSTFFISSYPPCRIRRGPVTRLTLSLYHDAQILSSGVDYFFQKPEKFSLD
jgi:hypothetical protein